VRRHLFNHHIADWVKACDDEKIQIRGVDAIRAVRQFRNLPEPTNLEAGRQQFSKAAFEDALAEFIVGDDQVCKKLAENSKTHVLYQALNVIESPRLRKIFLMLKKDLTEKDIPGRSTMRTRIDSMYQDHLQRLKGEMKV